MCRLTREPADRQIRIVSPAASEQPTQPEPEQDDDCPSGGGIGKKDKDTHHTVAQSPIHPRVPTVAAKAGRSSHVERWGACCGERGGDKGLSRQSDAVRVGSSVGVAHVRSLS